MDQPSFFAAVERARAQVDATGERQIVYTRGGVVTSLPLRAYKRLNLDVKGARRVCLVTPPLLSTEFCKNHV